MSPTTPTRRFWEKDVPRRRLAGQLAWFLVWLGITAVAIFLTPNPEGHSTHRQLGFPPCFSLLLTDRPCPGCGMTTSWTATVHGMLGLAFYAHPLGPIVYAIFTASAIAALVGFLKGWRIDGDQIWFQNAILILAVGFFAFGVARFAAMPHFSERPAYHADRP